MENLQYKQEDKEIEIRKLRIILSKNEYPPQVINDTIEVFVKKKHRPPDIPIEGPQEEKLTRYIVLPFINKKVEDFAVRLKTLVEKNYNKVDMNVAFKSPKIIGQLYPYKDRVLDKMNKSLVVYRIKCKNCEVSYIGETKRRLHDRVQEHKKGMNSSCEKHHILVIQTIIWIMITLKF